MATTTRISVEHVVVQSSRSYQEVKAALEERLGALSNIDEQVQRLRATKASWEQITQVVQQQLGTSGFAIFHKVEQGQMLALAGKPRKVMQYALGNPLLAIQMIERVPEVALYAPLRLAIYEDSGGKTFVAYDRFSSLVAHYRDREVAEIAEVVERTLEALIAEATGAEAGSRLSA